VKYTQLMQWISPLAITLLASSCGSPHDTPRRQATTNHAPLASLTAVRPDHESTAVYAPSLAPNAVDVAVSYRYENARPRVVNGRPVLDHRYWSCVDTVTVSYAQPMRLATVLGSTMITNASNTRRALTLRSFDPSFRHFTWGVTGDGICNEEFPLDRVVVKTGVWTVGGQTLTQDRQEALTYPANQNVLPEGITTDQAPRPSPTFGDSNQAMDFPVNTASARPDCAVNGTCFTVTPERLNQAISQMATWVQQERNNPLYAGTNLEQLPLAELLQAFAPANRSRQFGTPDLIYVLRRAAHFTHLLFPALQQIPVADMSEPDGSTPHTPDMALHPAGSHTGGKDADVAYITTGSGNDAGAPYDFERNFWFLYGVLKSTGPDLVMTAYKAKFSSMAQRAYDLGLINGHAAGRFEILMQDGGLNHDKHVHISVGNFSNRNQSRKFTASDDVYNCYLALHVGSANGARNYCDAD